MLKLNKLLYYTADQRVFSDEIEPTDEQRKVLTQAKNEIRNHLPPPRAQPLKRLPARPPRARPGCLGCFGTRTSKLTGFSTLYPANAAVRSSTQLPIVPALPGGR